MTGKYPSPNKQINVRVPPLLRSKIEAEAARQSKKQKRPVTIQEVILRTLAAVYSIEVPAPERGRPLKVDASEE